VYSVRLYPAEDLIFPILISRDHRSNVINCAIRISELTLHGNLIHHRSDGYDVKIMTRFRASVHDAICLSIAAFASSY
jgi:hypothetical protein